MTNRSLDQLLSEIREALEMGAASRRMLQVLRDEPGYQRYLELNPGMEQGFDLVSTMLDSLDQSKFQIREGLDAIWPESYAENAQGIRKGNRQILGILNSIRRQRQAERYTFPLSLSDD